MIYTHYKEGDTVVTTEDIYFKAGREGVVTKVEKDKYSVVKVYVKFPTRKDVLYFYPIEIKLVQEPKEIEWV